MTVDVLCANLNAARQHFEALHRGEEEDAFDFWRNATGPQPMWIFAALAPLARLYLSLSASSADLERSFSSAGFLYEGRDRLLAVNLEAQVVIRDFLLELRRDSQDDGEFVAQVSGLLDRLPDE